MSSSQYEAGTYSYGPSILTPLAPVKAAGLAVAIPCYAAYNYLVSRVNAIVLDMEKAATEIINIVTEPPGRKP